MAKKIAKYILATLSIPFGMIGGLVIGIVILVASIFKTSYELFNRILYGKMIKIAFKKLDDGNYYIEDDYGNKGIMSKEQFDDYIEEMKKKGFMVYGKEEK